MQHRQDEANETKYVFPNAFIRVDLGFCFSLFPLEFITILLCHSKH